MGEGIIVEKKRDLVNDCFGHLLWLTEFPRAFWFGRKIKLGSGKRPPRLAFCQALIAIV